MSSATDTATPSLRPPSLGESLPYFAQIGCVYLDWNGA